MNSLKSACSFAKVTPMPFDELQQHVQPLFWGQISVELIVGEGAKESQDAQTVARAILFVV
jgi:hypothetical protein